MILSKVKLLIEPVWNRNLLRVASITTVKVSFNRTSLESKPWKAERDGVGYALLIEPVWNRNTGQAGEIIDIIGTLLIEPVWNRNYAQSGY